MTDQAEPPSEIEIQTNETPIVSTRYIYRSDDTDILTTTASNAEVALNREWKRVRGGHDWVTPLGILLPIVLGLLTTDFVARFGVSADQWKAVFIVGAVASLVWLVAELIRQWLRGPALTAQQIVALLMIPPTLTPSQSALAAVGHVGDGNPGKPQAHGTDLQNKAPISAAEPKVVGDQGSRSIPPSSLSALGRSCPPTRTAVEGQARGSKTPIVPDSANSGESAPKVSPGGRVRHPDFGVGTVLNIRPGAVHTFVEVGFDDPDVGTKNLRADLAPLQHVGDEA